jgi:hypothetical protein
MHAHFKKLLYRLRNAFPSTRRGEVLIFDAPRDLDDPMNDPAVQDRIGRAIAGKSKMKSERRRKR